MVDNFVEEDGTQSLKSLLVADNKLPDTVTTLMLEHAIAVSKLPNRLGQDKRLGLSDCVLVKCWLDEIYKSSILVPWMIYYTLKKSANDVPTAAGTMLAMLLMK